MKLPYRIVTVASIAALFGVSIILPAVAADTAADWIKPASTGATSLATSLKTIGAPILGLCLAGFGGWAVMTGHIDFRRLWMFLLGGMFIAVGPTFATWFMALFSATK